MTDKDRTIHNQAKVIKENWSELQTLKRILIDEHPDTMNNTTNFMKMFMMLQDMSEPIDANVKETIKRKERIVFATPGIIKPNDWETLSDQEKINRLNKVQNQ